MWKCGVRVLVSVRGVEVWGEGVGECVRGCGGVG